jgi:UDP-N-acetylglucosamine transferase subunit ALG13
MIFVTVGTDRAPFDRLLQAVERLDTADEIVVQHGASTVRPANATCVDFLPFDEWVDHIRRADTVVTHGGVGSIMVALMNGKKPIVVPRLHRFREAVDDHQEVFGRRFGADGHVVYVEDPAGLAAALGTAETAVTYMAPPDPLANDLRSYIDSLIGRNGSSPH